MHEGETIDRFSWKRQIPAIRLFEAAGLALSPGSILLASLASLALYVSGWLVDRVLPTQLPNNGLNVVLGSPAQIEQSLKHLQSGGLNGANASNPLPILVGPPSPQGILERWPFHFGLLSGSSFFAFETLTKPWSNVIQPARLFLNPTGGRNAQLKSAIQFAIALGIWSLVGMILCRRSAFLFAGDDESTLRKAVQYSMKRWPTSVRAPLIPLSAVLLTALITVGLGIVARLPFLGSLWLLLVSPGLLVLGFVMAFLLLATVLSWPLMVAAVSIEDCDSFSGLSRAYSSLTGRPWHAIAYGLLGLVIGSILMSFTNLASDLTIWCAMSVTEIGSGAAVAQESLHVPLSRLAELFVSAVGISCFWSVATVIYLLLRLDVDGVPLDRIALDDDARPAHVALPVVGIPATDAKMESNGSVNHE